ncbi:Armadillo-type fold containing protein [Cryptosporidium felis]|nr:Armadillo-type fold containing protein [Cryptosporidium felis]
MDSAEILFCLLDSLDNCDLATEASVYSTVVDFAKSTNASSNCVGLVSNAITSFLQVSHTSVNHQLSLLRLLSLIISSYAIYGDAVLTKGDGDLEDIGIINATNFSINGEISSEEIEFFENLTRFVLNEYICLKNNDPRRVALLQVLVSLVFLIPDRLIEILLLVAEESRSGLSGNGISSILVAISAISKISPEVVCRKGHDIIVELLSLLQKAASGDTGSKTSVNYISKVELVRCLADVADALRSSNLEKTVFAGLIGTAFDVLLNDWVPAIQKDKDGFFLSFPTLETLGHLAQVIDDEQLKQHAPKLLSVYLQIFNSLLSKKNKYFPSFVGVFSEPSKEIDKCEDLLQNNIYTLRWRQYHAVAAMALMPAFNSKSETIAISLHYSILSGFKLFLDRCHLVCCTVFKDQDVTNLLLSVLVQYCAIFHRLYAPAILPGHTAYTNTTSDAVILCKEPFESKNGLNCHCWDIQAVKDIITTHYELVLCWKSLIRQDFTRETVIRFIFENIDIKSANRLSAMFIFSSIIEDIPFEKVCRVGDSEITIAENSNSPLGSLLYRLARTTLEQGLDYSIAFVLCGVICKLSQYGFLHIGSTLDNSYIADTENIGITDEFTNNPEKSPSFDYRRVADSVKGDEKSIWISPSPSSAEMLTYFLRLLAVPELKAKNEHFRHIQRQKLDYQKMIQASDGIHIPVIYPPSLWDLRCNAQYVLSEELTALVPDLLWPLLIDAVNHLKLGSAMPTVCESLSKSCRNLYQKSTPEAFYNAFRHQDNRYLTLSDPYKIFVWLCMYAHDPHIYNGALAYWALQCLQWISPMIVSSPSCIWACIPSQRLQSLIEITNAIIMPSNSKDSEHTSIDFTYRSSRIQDGQTFDLSSKIDIDCWFPLVDECISYILSGMSGNPDQFGLTNQGEEHDFVTKTTIDKEIDNEKKYVIKSSDLASKTIVNLLSALFSACRDIRSDKVQKSSDTPTELQRAGMYSLLGLLLREIGPKISETLENKSIEGELRHLRGTLIYNILDGVLTPDCATSSESGNSNVNSVSGGLINNQGRSGLLKKDSLDPNEMQVVKEITKQFFDLQNFFHAIGVNSSILQKSCGRSIGYASSHHHHFILISEYLLDLIRSDAANKRSGAFSFFGKSLAVVQAEQLRSTILLSLGHSIGEAPVTLFNSGIETIRKILQVLETAIKEEKELQLQCSALKAIQIAFQALSSDGYPELTLSSRISSVLNKINSDSGKPLKIDLSGLEKSDISLELFSSFRNRIFPYILTIIVFSTTIELPPAPLNSMLLLKAASGMPYNTSSAISSQRIHTDPSGSYIRSMVRYRDISIGSFETLDYAACLENEGVTAHDFKTPERDPSSSQFGRVSNSNLENDDILFGPFNLTLSVLSVLSENPQMTSDNSNCDEVFYTLDIPQSLGISISKNPALKDIILNLGNMKNRNLLGMSNGNSSVFDTSVHAIHSGTTPGYSGTAGSFEKAKSPKLDDQGPNSQSSGFVAGDLNAQVSDSKLISTGLTIQASTIGTGVSNVSQGSNTSLNTSINSSCINNINNGNGGNIVNSSGTISNSSGTNMATCNNSGNHGIGNTSNINTSNSIQVNNTNNTASTSSPANTTVFNKLLLDALDTSISLISFPSPLLPKHIPLVVSSCLTILVSISTRVKFRNFTEDGLSDLKSFQTCNLPISSLNVIDSGFRLEELMYIIEDVSVPTNSSEVSAFKVLDSLDRLYLNIFKSHMPSWNGLTHLLEGLLGLAATATSSVLRCICVHVAYCLLCEAPLVEIFQQSQINQKLRSKDLHSLNTRATEGAAPPIGTWIPWMHCVALVLGRTCDSCFFVRIIAFECIKECIKRCVWTQGIDISLIKALNFGGDGNFKFSNIRKSCVSISNSFEIDEGKKTIENQNDSSPCKNRSEIQSLILPINHLDLLYNLANCIPAFCLRPLCQHILPSFHDSDRVAAHSSVESIRVLFTINNKILENETFACRIVSSLFDEISSIKDVELQHFVYILIRYVVSCRFQSAISEIFGKCIKPQKYMSHYINNDKNSGDFIENIVINSSWNSNSEWTAVDLPFSDERASATSSHGSVISSFGNGIRSVINIICVVDPVYSKAISYIGRDKLLLLESFRYLTDVLNNTEQKYTDIIETNEKLCIKILSSNINNSGSMFNNMNPVNNTSSPNHNSVTSLIGSGMVIGGALTGGVQSVSGASPGNNFSNVNKSLLFPISALSVLSNEQINLRSSTLALDILLQTNDSAIKVIAKKHFSELISTILLRCCSTMGYINMGALESSNALRSLFLALFDSDAILTFFDANQLKLSLVKPSEFDHAVIKLLCHIYTHTPDLTFKIMSFILPFLRRVHSIYSMSALILLVPTPLGIYQDENNRLESSSESMNKLYLENKFKEIYSLELLDSILNIIKVTNNPYTKKNGFSFFQWYFWYCLESNKYPNKDFIMKFLNISFLNIIGGSLQKIPLNNKNEKTSLQRYGQEDNQGRSVDASGIFRMEEKNINSKISDEFDVFGLANVSDEEKYSDNRMKVRGGRPEDNDSDPSVYEDVCNKEESSSGTPSRMDSESNTCFLHSEDKFLDTEEIKMPFSLRGSSLMSKKSVVSELMKECLVSLRYLVCLISVMRTGVPLQVVPEHPPICLGKCEPNEFSDRAQENKGIFRDFIEMLFFSGGLSDSLQIDCYQTLDVESNDGYCDTADCYSISDIFMDLITNSDIDIYVTNHKMYLLLDILILIRQNWEEITQIQFGEKLRSSIKKLLIPLLVRLEEPVLELSRSVWRAIQLVLSIILTEDEWISVVGEIHRKLILDDLIAQNSTSLSLIGHKNSISSPFSTSISPTSMNKIRVSKSLSGTSTDKILNTIGRPEVGQHIDEKCNLDIYTIHVGSFVLPYGDEMNDEKYRYILPSKYNKISKKMMENNVNTVPKLLINGDGVTSLNKTLNPSSKFIHVKYFGECEIMCRYLLPIMNPIESNNYQQFLNCIIPFIIYSETLKEGSLNLKGDPQKADVISRRGSSNREIKICNIDSCEKNILDLSSEIKINRLTLKELGRRIDDCHLYLNRCRYYFPREVWEIAETTFSVIPKELDRIRKEAETQHLLFNRNIFGEMVNSLDSSDGVGILGQRSLLDKSLEEVELRSSPNSDSIKSRFSFSSQNNGISIPSFARAALSRFNTLWNANKTSNTKKEDPEISNNIDNPGVEFGPSNERSLTNKLNKSDSDNRQLNQSPRKEQVSNKDVLTANDNIDSNIGDISSGKLESLSSITRCTNSISTIPNDKLPETLEQQLNIKKMELISEYIKYPSTLKSLERYRENNENMKSVVEGISAILASTFIKYISIELFQHFYTSETFMLIACREISKNYELGNSSNTDSAIDSQEQLDISNCLENEELMATIDKLLSLESLVAAICKQISTFVAQSHSPSRHRFAKALANLVYISFKP